MATVFYDRVKDTFTTTGTGTLTVANSAPTGYQPTSTVGNGNSSYFVAYDSTGANWEAFAGTYTASGTVLSRDTILASSNGGAAVSWAAGTKTLELDFPAARITACIKADRAANLTAGYTATVYTGIGTITSGTVTPDPANGQFQSYTANGAHTLAPPSVASGAITLIHMIVTNGASAGAITTSGFTVVEGDTYATTNAAVWELDIYAEHTYSRLSIRGPR